MNKYVAILLVILAGAAIFTFVSSSMSLIDDGNFNSKPSCEVPLGGGNCDLILELPEGQKLADGYSFDVETISIHDDEFKDERELFIQASGGPYEERDRLESEYIDYEHEYSYVFQPPFEWENAYEFKTTTKIAGAYARTSGEGKTTISLYSGYITIPYPYSQIEVCETHYSSDCYNGDYALVRNYVSSDGLLTISAPTHVAYPNGADTLYVRGDSSSVPSSLQKDLVIENEFLASSLPEQDARFLAFVRKDIKYEEPSVTLGQPTMVASWKEEYSITDLKVTIGDEQVYSGNGIADEKIYLPEISSAVNSYCQRDGLFPDDSNCVIRMRLTSSEAGVITIANELGQLEEVGGDFNANAITGWITFDFENDSSNATTTLIILSLFVGGLAYVIIFVGDKKK